MAEHLPPPSAEQLGWLTVAPPTDEHAQPIAWTLSDCHIDETKFAAPIVHEQLTLLRVRLTAVQWQAAVFRNCVVREVEFGRTNFVGVRFESVTFERCSFDEVTFENCEFDHCRLVDCTIRYGKAIRTALRFCELERLSLSVFDMREGELSGAVVRDSSLHGPRLSTVRAHTLTIVGGELRGGDWTACELGTLALDDVDVDGLRILDGSLGQVRVSEGQIEGLAIAGVKIDGLALLDCEALAGARILSCALGQLSLQRCASVGSLAMVDCTIAGLEIADSKLFDPAFEQLVVERGRIDGCELFGVFFHAGVWQALGLHDVSLFDYVAVTGARFEALSLVGVSSDPQLDVRLDGDQYGDGSMTWGSARGS